MFSWKINQDRELDPYFRAVYVLELVAAVAALAGLFLVWWQGVETFTGFDLLARSADDLRRRDPSVLGQPLVVLWLLWPVIVVSLLRGLTGIQVTPVAFRRLAQAAWVAAALALAHFYINFGDDVPARSPLRDGTIQLGFWLTCSSNVILGLLLLTEETIRPRAPVFVVRQETTGPVDDPERLWRGDYQTCPFCGMLNEPAARTCYNCKNLMFNFKDKD